MTNAWATAGVAAVLAAVCLIGCASSHEDATADDDEDGTILAAAMDRAPAPASAPAEGRAALWADNCARCHNARPASFYSANQWRIAMHHMRVRGGLTAAETQAIWEFFQASK
jgi:hypothetical protein